jgi:hypothetical protein
MFRTSGLLFQSGMKPVYKIKISLIKLRQIMYFEYEIEGGNFSRAGYASSEVKKKLKQLNVDCRLLKELLLPFMKLK